jgi:hypothetical protein
MIRLETRDLTGQPARPLDLIELAVGDPARPARARLADVCIKAKPAEVVMAAKRPDFRR